MALFTDRQFSHTLILLFIFINVLVSCIPFVLLQSAGERHWKRRSRLPCRGSEKQHISAYIMVGISAVDSLNTHSQSDSLNVCEMAVVYMWLPYFMWRLFSLQGVSAGTSGAIALADALMTNQSLQTLEWVDNFITRLLFAHFINNCMFLAL